MPNDPLVTFVVTLTVSEEGEALAGQGVVYVGGEPLETLRLDREHLEVPYAIAAEHAISACRDWLKIRSATKELKPPPTRRKKTKEEPAQTAKIKRVSGTPTSRRRIVSKRLPT